MLMPFVFFLLSLVQGFDLNNNVFFKFAAILGVLCYIFIMLFHPLSTEMSEWGYWILMVSWLSRIYKYDDAGLINVGYGQKVGC